MDVTGQYQQVCEGHIGINMQQNTFTEHYRIHLAAVSMRGTLIAAR